jgi:hypothetical protein
MYHSVCLSYCFLVCIFFFLDIMIMFRLLPVILTPSFGSFNVRISPFNLAIFPVDFVLNTTDQVLPGHLLLHLGSNHSPLREDTAVESETESRIVAARVANGAVTLEYRIDRRILSVGNIGILSAGPMSSFALQFGSFLFNPLRDTFGSIGQIILTPSNPTEYAYEGQMYYGSNLDTNSWTVNTSVGILGHDTTLFSTLGCRIESNGRRMVVPRSILYAVYERMQALGVDVELNLGGIQIRSTLTSAQIETLPIIQFLLNDQDGNRINIAHIYPREYLITAGGRSFCSFQESSRFDCAFSSDVFRKAVLHFDVINNRVGFADPIDEI